MPRPKKSAVVDQPLWDAVQAQHASNVAERNSGTRNHQPSLLAGLLFDGDGNRMTPSHAVKIGTRYRYYVSSSLITKDRTETSAGLRIPAAEIEHLVQSRAEPGVRIHFPPGRVHCEPDFLDPDNFPTPLSTRSCLVEITDREKLPNCSPSKRI